MAGMVLHARLFYGICGLWSRSGRFWMGFWWVISVTPVRGNARGVIDPFVCRIVFLSALIKSDVLLVRAYPAISVFQSTLTVGGATQAATCGYGLRQGISIHAPRAGSDSNIAQISDDRAAILRHGFQTGSSADCGKIVVNQQKTFFIAVSGARTSRTFYVYRRFASGGRSEDQCIGHIN